MNERLLELLPLYGLPALGLVVGLGCLGLPVPSSLFILVAGSFAAAGDFDPVAVFLVCLAGALLADNLGFLIGRRGGAFLERRFAARIERARGLLDRSGGAAVFLSRWLVSPLGPAVNLVAGATGFRWRRFLAFDLAGEVLWVLLYMGLGASFGALLPQVAEILANASAALAFAALAAGLGWLFIRRRRGHSPPPGD